MNNTTNYSNVESALSELGAFSLRIQALASLKPQAFVNRFYQDLFGVDSLVGLLDYWILEYHQEDLVETFVLLLNDLISQNPILQINPDSISIFRNIRLLIPFDQLQPKILIYIAMFVQFHRTFFSRSTRLHEGFCFGQPIFNFTSRLQLDILLDALFCVFMKTCKSRNYDNYQIRIHLTALSGRLVVLQRLSTHADLIYRSFSAFKSVLYLQK